MKNKIKILLASVLALTGCDENNNNNSNSVSESTSTSSGGSEQMEEDTVFPKSMYESSDVEEDTYHLSNVSEHTSSLEDISSTYKKNYIDSNLAASDVTYAEFYEDGILQDDITYKESSYCDDVFFFYGNDKARIVSRPEGYCLTIPTTKIIKPDFDKSYYRKQYYTDSFCLTVTHENKNVYDNWETYRDEWLTKYISLGTQTTEDDLNSYLENNNLELTRKTIKNQTFLQGYEVERISIHFNDADNIEYPYYNIAIIREPSSINEFYLLVCKSKTRMETDFDNIVISFKTIVPFGTLSKPNTFELKIPSYWSEETQRYYKKMIEQDYTDWGFFNHSMYANGTNEVKIMQRTMKLEKEFDYSFDIMPTYTHTGRYTNPGKFPLNSAINLAGGNGFNGKPVLQFTIQFTANNNGSLFEYNPMLDILRGKYDSYFKDMAQDMKEYGKPILFRINNEMNTDWTSYCGMGCLLDPDLFAKAWERMCQIFIDEGCDNLMFIFNPNSISFPYSNWGEDLCYMPDLKYVHFLGLTYYDFNNGKTGTKPNSFTNMYNTLYEKNSPMWDYYPAIISEFACGAGGATTGMPYRNVASQTEWVEECLDVLNNQRNEYLFASQIKGAVWFNADDYSGSKIMNLLQLDSTKSATTIAAFKEGLAETKERRNNDEHYTLEELGLC